MSSSDGRDRERRVVRPEPRALFLARHSFADHARLSRHARSLERAGFNVLHMRLSGDQRPPLPPTIEVDIPSWALRRFEQSAENFFEKSLRSLAWQFAQQRLTSEGRRLAPQLVVACDPESLSVAARIATSGGARLVLDCQEYFAGMVESDIDRRRWITREFERWGARVDACLAVSETLGALQAEEYPSLPIPVIVPNASDVPPLKRAYDGRLHKAAGWSQERRIALFQGGFGKARGLAQCIESADLLDGSWGVALLGAGEDADALAALAAQRENVAIIPAVPSGELQDWTCGAEVGLIPYEAVGQNNTFCLPNKLWEYASCGIPIVSRDLPEISNVLTRFNAGATFPIEGSAIEIAATLNALSRSRLASMRRGAASFYQLFGWKSVEGAFLDACHAG